MDPKDSNPPNSSNTSTESSSGTTTPGSDTDSIQFTETDPLQTNYDLKDELPKTQSDPWKNNHDVRDYSPIDTGFQGEQASAQSPSSYPPPPQLDTYQPQQQAFDNKAVLPENTGSVNFNNPPSEPKKSSIGLKLFLFFLFILILFAGSVGGLFVVAYDKIETPIPEKTQEKISFFVQSLPFTPKTAKYLLVKSAVAQEEVKTGSFDLSAALNFSENDDLLGLNAIDFTIKGVSDISDPKDIQTSFNMSVTKDFNMDFRKKDKMLYFKINKLPAFLFAFAGIDTSKLDPLLNHWVSYDTSPLDTEARKALDEAEANETETENIGLDKFFDQKILKEFKVSDDNLDGNPVYKLSLNTNDDLLDYMFKKIESELSQGRQDLFLKDSNSSASPQKISDVIKNGKMELLIDKSSYYTRKVTLAFDMVNNQKTAQATDAPVLGDYSSLFSSSSKASFAMVIKLDDFGKPITIEIPSSSEETMTFEEFTSKLSEIVVSMYGSSLGGINPTGTFEKAQDVQRKADLQQLRAALELHRSDCSTYPTALSELTNSKESCVQSEFLSELPNDPLGIPYYYQAALNGMSYDLCAKLTTPEPSYDTCPDTNYNYHITSP